MSDKDNNNRQAFPLCWPDNWARTMPNMRLCSRFDKQLTIAKACEFLELHLGRLKAKNIVLSTNVQPTLRGTPRSIQSEPNDTGVAVYFTFRSKQVSLACDKWTRVADNIWAIAKHIEALRGQERWGVGSLEQAFRGYTAIPERSGASSWWKVLEVGINATQEQIQEAYRRKAKELHPDVGGTNGQMAELNLAYKEALQQ